MGDRAMMSTYYPKSGQRPEDNVRAIADALAVYLAWSFRNSIAQVKKTTSSSNDAALPETRTAENPPVSQYEASDEAPDEAQGKAAEPEDDSGTFGQGAETQSVDLLSLAMDEATNHPPVAQEPDRFAPEVVELDSSSMTRINPIHPINPINPAWEL